MTNGWYRVHTGYERGATVADTVRIERRYDRTWVVLTWDTSEALMCVRWTDAVEGTFAASSKPTTPALFKTLAKAKAWVDGGFAGSRNVLSNGTERQS